MVRCAGASSVVKPAAQVTDEFFLQGDAERAMGMNVSPTCDRLALMDPALPPILTSRTSWVASRLTSRPWKRPAFRGRAAELPGTLPGRVLPLGNVQNRARLADATTGGAAWHVSLSGGIGKMRVY